MLMTIRITMRIEDFLKKNFFTIAEYGQFKNFASNCPTAFSSVSDSVFFRYIL